MAMKNSKQNASPTPEMADAGGSAEALFPLRSVLVSTDLSAASDVVLQSAAAVAERAGATLHVVHVAGKDDDTSDEPRAALEAQLTRCLDEAERHRVRAVVVNDRPFHGILVRAAEVRADLLVVGPQRAAGRLWSRLRASTAERVARGSDVPCLVVRSPLTSPVRRLGVATHFSMADRGALDLAQQWAPLFGDADTTVTLAHVASAKADDELRARLEEEATRSQDALSAVHPPSSALLEGGSPASVLAEWAQREALNMLVVTARDQRSQKAFGPASVAASVAAKAPCSVLMVPTYLWRRAPLRITRLAFANDEGVEQTDPAADASWLSDLIAPGAMPSPPVVLEDTDDVAGASRAVDADLLVFQTPPVAETGGSLSPKAKTVLETATQPVLMLRDVPRDPPRHVLVAVDTGAGWYEKFSWAKLLVDRFDVKLNIFHAVTLSPWSHVKRVAGGEFLPSPSVWLDNVEDTVVPAMEAWLRERVHLAGLPEERAEVVVGLQDPGFALKMMMKRRHADLAIVAPHRSAGAERASLSRIARAVLEGGSYPVLAVVGRERRIAAQATSSSSASSSSG